VRWLGAGLAALVFVLLAPYVAAASLFATALASYRPDPRAHDGDPCCPHPDTWGDVAQSAAGAVFGATVSGALLGLAAAVLWQATRDRVPRWLGSSRS
jgi:hypothetical protein